MTDPAIRSDIARFARAVDRHCLEVAAPRLADFAGPVRVVWGTADRCFALESAKRLTAAFSDAELIEVPGVSTFVPIDAPEAVADAIVQLVGPISRRAQPSA
jgi:pimeloyl-ACP methyl ester carboxylesterase